MTSNGEQNGPWSAGGTSVGDAAPKPADAKWSWAARFVAFALLMAAIALLWHGSIPSTVAFLLAAFMGWSNAFRINRERGKPTLTNRGRQVVGSILTMLGFGLWLVPNSEPITVADRSTQNAASVAVACPTGSQKVERDVEGLREVNLLKEPRNGAAAFPMALGKDTVPAPMILGDPVRELCKQSDWSLVRVISPAKELYSLRGWVPSSTLKKVTTNQQGRRIYSEQDFDWPKGTPPRRTDLVRIMNRIMAERPDCEALDTGNLVSNGRAANVTYSVPCILAGADMASFDFTPKDVTDGPSFARLDAIGKIAAVEVCKNAVLGEASHPSTVVFPTFDYDYRDGGNGRSQLLMSAKAKNGFGLELTYDVQCDLIGSKLDRILMSEASQ